MPDYPTFRVGAVFPADERNAALMQLMLTTRQWMVLSRALFQDLPTDVQNEQFLHIMLLGAGAAKEAADSFRRCDELKWFEDLLLPPLRNNPDPLALARRECTGSNPKSLYEQVLQRVRNNAGFHWSSKLLARGLRELSAEEVPAAQGGLTNFDTSIPLALVLASQVLSSQGLAMEGVREALPA